MLFKFCGISRDYCDKQFNKCLKNKCQNLPKNNDNNKNGKNTIQNEEQCLQTTNLLTMGTSMFGCQAFLLAQNQSCICFDANKEENKIDEMLYNIIDSLYYSVAKNSNNETPKKTQQKIMDILNDYKNKESILIYNIIQKYSKFLVHKESKFPKKTQSFKVDP